MLTGMHSHPGAPAALLLVAVVGPFALAVVVYLVGALAENRAGGRGWPWHRAVCWLFAVSVLAAATVGPLAEQAHADFVAHTAVHLMVGMLAPILVVLSAPVTLALRRLDPAPARRLARLLNSPPVGFLTHPVPAMLLSIGSLWALYATPLTRAMTDPVLHYAVLAHFFIVGYLLTASIVSIDPAPHRARFGVRLTALILAIASHTVLAKHIFAHPPSGVSPAQAEAAGLLMYYGGDVLELILVITLFTQAGRRADRRASLLAGARRAA